MRYVNIFAHKRKIMAFKNYQIFIFDEKTGSRKTMRLPSFFISIFILFVGALGAGNVFLGTHYYKTILIQEELALAKNELEKKEMNLLGIIAELDTLREDIYRIKQFGNKLRATYSDDFQEDTVASVGGAIEYNLSAIPLHRQELANSKIHGFISELKKEIQLEELVQQDLLLFLKENMNKLASTPSIWPVQGGYVSSKFGMRKSPFTGVKQLHKGIDIVAPRGTSIVSSANGKVIFSGNDGAYGLSLEIDHGYGVVSRYAHMNKLLVKKGETVNRNQQIGEVGNTGRSTGPHLHYEIIVNGVPTNPYAYIFDK